MKFSKVYRKVLRMYINKRNCKRLINNDFTIISSNCVGGVISHELGQKFNSPTVNCWFYNKDFVRFCENLGYYVNGCELQCDEKESKEMGYPVGDLAGIKIYFLHYRTFDEAKIKWDERKQRINWDNIYLTMMQSSADDDDLLERYLKLPYQKVLFTIKNNSTNKCFCYLEGTIENGEIKDLCQYEHKFTGRRLIDKFDYVAFLNSKVMEK